MVIAIWFMMVIALFAVKISGITIRKAVAMSQGMARASVTPPIAVERV